MIYAELFVFFCSLFSNIFLSWLLFVRGSGYFFDTIDKLSIVGEAFL